MSKGLKIGAKVSGERGKVLDKGDFTEANRKETVFGTVSAQLGVGRGRKWTVVWETVQKSTTLPARRLTVVSNNLVDDIPEASSSSESEASSEPSDAGAAGCYWSL